MQWKCGRPMKCVWINQKFELSKVHCISCMFSGSDPSAAAEMDSPLCGPLHNSFLNLPCSGLHTTQAHMLECSLKNTYSYSSAWLLQLLYILREREKACNDVLEMIASQRAWQTTPGTHRRFQFSFGTCSQLNLNQRMICVRRGSWLDSPRKASSSVKWVNHCLVSGFVTSKLNTTTSILLPHLTPEEVCAHDALGICFQSARPYLRHVTRSCLAGLTVCSLAMEHSPKAKAKGTLFRSC